jgi:hypothetical protein
MKPLPGYIISKTRGKEDKLEYIVLEVHDKEKDLKKGDKILLAPKPEIFRIYQEDNRFIIPISCICAVK